MTPGAAAINDDLAARVFERHRLDVYRWALRLLGRHDDALDISQDVGLRWLLQCRQGVPANAGGWLRRVTVNRSVDRLRGSAVRLTQTSPDLDERAQRPGPGRGPDGPLAQEELRQKVALAIRELSDMQRQVLVAKIWDGLTFEEIGGDLDIVASTARTHYLRALTAMRDQLKDWSDEENP